MSDSQLTRGALVLYKDAPGVIRQVGAKKIEIEVDGQSLSVRPKDVTLLHAGPLSTPAQLTPVQGEVKTAWELLAGETTTLSELAELAYGACTPQTAWAAWQHVADGLYFSGTPDAVVAHTTATVAETRAARAAREAEKAAWDAFLARARAGVAAPEDAGYLNEVAALAMGRQERSKVLRALDETESPEAAHAFLLNLGYWDETVNPYPARLGQPTADPELPLPPLPPESRRDLTHLVALAIDDEGNQDPDDAISWEGGDFPDGRLWVHIADVAALAPPDGPADLEARARGANLYLPEGTVHMLPPAATADLALGLAGESPALSFALAVTANGEVVLTEVVPSRVRVTRLSYAAAEAQLDREPLPQLQAAGGVYAARRAAQGAVELDLPEVRLRLVDGAVDIRPLPRLRSREMVRDAMLMAGEAVGRFALQQQLPLPFTTQDPPLPAADLPDGLAGEFARRKLMQRSQQGGAPGPHAGLGLPVYVQCTSPLRRYLDLVVHQQLRAWLRGTGVLAPAALMERVGAADAVSGSVRTAERLSNTHWTLVHLRRHSGWTGAGVVVDKRGRRDVVLVPELAHDFEVAGRGDRPLNTRVTLAWQGDDLPRRRAFFRVAVAG